jgi:hypothetical protein
MNEGNVRKLCHIGGQKEHEFIAVISGKKFFGSLKLLPKSLQIYYFKNIFVSKQEISSYCCDLKVKVNKKFQIFSKI